MSSIKSRKHAPVRFNPQMSAAIAAMLLPMAGHAADAVDAVDPNAPVAEVRVVGNLNNDFKAEKASSPKYTEELVNTAQTVQVITKELIEQQGAVTLTEALRNSPGVGAFFLGENGSTTTGDAVFMRGFDTSNSIYVDGVRDVGTISRDTFNLEQIDVLKGPAGTDNGRSAPTGSINLVSKRPTLTQSGAVSVTGGSGSQKRATADYNTLLDADSGTALRINALDQDSGNPARDLVKNKRWAIAPSVAFGLKGPTRVYADLLHVKQNNRPDGGVPTIGLPGYTSPDPVGKPYLTTAAPVDSGNFYGSRGDYDRVTADMVTLRVEHDFSPMVKLLNTTRYGRTKQDYLLSAFLASGANINAAIPDPRNPARTIPDPNVKVNDPSTWTLVRGTRTLKDQENKITTNQTNVTAGFDGVGMKHTLVGGLELTREEQENFSYTGLGTLANANLYNPSPDAIATPVNLVRTGAFTDGQQDTASLYAFDTAKLGAEWIFNGGVRVDHYKTDYHAAVVTNGVSTPSQLGKDGNLVNGKLSALYKPTADSSVYALVASSKLPPGASFALSTAANSAQNINFEPQETLTKEVGAKMDLLKQRLSFTLALYRTEVKNEVEQDPVDKLYYQTGKKVVQGVEIGMTGELSRKWLISTGYTRMNTSVESGKVVTASGINNLSYTPKQAFTLWTSYTLPMGLTIGGGARYRDRLLRGTDGAIGTPAYADSYWVYDAMAAYQFSKNIDVRLNVYNLSDAAYVASINKSGYRYTPGAPRSGSLTANFRF